MHKVLLDLHRVFVRSPPKAPGEASYVRIYNDAFDNTKRIALYNICRLPRNSWQAEQPGHGVRHFATELGENALGGGTDILRLVAIKPGRANILL
jgi:hypothetical protein